MKKYILLCGFLLNAHVYAQEKKELSSKAKLPNELPHHLSLIGELGYSRIAHDNTTFSSVGGHFQIAGLIDIPVNFNKYFYPVVGPFIKYENTVSEDEFGGTKVHQGYATIQGGVEGGLNFKPEKLYDIFFTVFGSVSIYNKATVATQQPDGSYQSTSTNEIKNAYQYGGRVRAYRDFEDTDFGVGVGITVGRGSYTIKPNDLRDHSLFMLSISSVYYFE